MVHFFSLILITAITTWASSTYGIDAEAYEAQIRRGMVDWQIPGLATAVLEDGELAYANGFGRTLADGGVAVTADTPFAIASTTKAMLVAGLLIQVDQGAIALDDPVVNVLPELRFGDPALADKLTLRDLLSHRTGMPSTDFLRFAQGMSIEQQLKHLPFIDAVTAPRTRLIYQNTMYELAGLILERLSGETWGDYLATHLWAPLGMAHTAATRGQLPSDLVLAQPHDVVDGQLRQVDNSRPPNEANAAGSVWSTANDMMRWAQFLLRGGLTESGERLISEAAFTEWFEPAQLAHPDDFYPVTALTKPRWRSYALGWFQQDFAGRRIDFHTGSLSGMVAILGLDRDAGNAVVVLANRDHAELRHALLWHALDQRPDAAAEDWHTAVWSLYQSIRAEADEEWARQTAGQLDAPSPVPPAAYVGDYRSLAWGPLSVRDIDGQLRLLAQSREFPLEHWHNTTFLATHKDWQRGMLIEFRLKPDGTIGAVELRGMSFDRR